MFNLAFPDTERQGGFGRTIEYCKRYFSYNTATTAAGEVVFNGNNYGLQAPRRFILSTDVRF